MSERGPPPDAAEIMEHVDEALQGLELEPHETAEILGFVNREVPRLQTPERSYFVLGSYREPYLRRLRIVQDRLDERYGAYPFLMGDLPDLDVERIPTFQIRFNLLAAYADYVVAVYEQDAGGEITELGKLSSTPYFEKSYVLPRDYDWMTDRKLDSRESVFTATTTIYYNEDLDSRATEDELDEILTAARRNGIDVSRDTILDRVQEREDAPVTYSWVHLKEFRLFELHDQCFPWATPAGLREATANLP